MNQNEAAVRALHEYVGITKPHYAFMIEAPWGAGKTYLVKNELKDFLSKDKARYVTLNGVSDRKSFRRALLANTSEAKLTDAARKFGDVVGTLAKVGNVGSLVQDAVEERLINNLPDLLIFDDVERCEMSPAELLGLINEFVEHLAKNVVLCAFIERDDADKYLKKRDDFLSRKEKVVGRTVKIVADARSALPEFISAMHDGHGKHWFNSNKGLVLEVFSSATHSNLRVLRQCLHDCGRVIDVMDEDIRTSTEAMIRFVRTYLALSMAVATGEINSQQLLERNDYQSVMKPKEGETAHPFYTCYRQHPKAEIYAGNAASILPLEIGYSLIGIGYEAPDKINDALRSTGQFDGNKEVPLWARFVKWRRMSRVELKNTYDEAIRYIFESDEMIPGPYLLTAHDLITIDEDGRGKGSETAAKIKLRIEELSRNKKIPPAKYGINYGWSDEMRRFRFGGYVVETDDLTKPIIESMRIAQFEAFKKARVCEADRLLKLLRDDLDAFGHEVSRYNGSSSFCQTTILHEIDAVEFAKEVFCYVTSGEIKAIGAQLKALAEQILLNKAPEEMDWAKTVKTELDALAKDAGQLETARMVWFLRLSWNFQMGEEVGE